MSYADVAALRDEYLRQTARSGSGEHAAVAVLLGFEPIAATEGFAKHVTRSRIDWEKMKFGDNADARFLVHTAAAMWSGRQTLADISRVPFLSDDYLQTWQDIIAAALTGCVPFHAGTR